MKWILNKKSERPIEKMPVTVAFHNKEVGYSTNPLWYCSYCKTLYGIEEICIQVLKPNDEKELHCPNCFKPMATGSEEWFSKNYDMKPL